MTYRHPLHRASRFFGLGITALVLGAYGLASWVDSRPEVIADHNALKQAALRTALSRQIDAETRDAAAQAYCGNAAWKISEDNKVLTCMPRKGKAYVVKLPVP